MDALSAATEATPVRTPTARTGQPAPRLRIAMRRVAGVVIGGVVRASLVIAVLLLAGVLLAGLGPIPATARLHDEAAQRFAAGDVAVARSLLAQAWRAHQAAGTDHADDALAVLFDLGASHLRLGELGDARRCFALAAAGFEAHAPPDSMALSLALEGLTAALVAQENTAEARTQLARTRALRRPLFGPEHPQMVRLDALEARLARLDGRPRDALAAMERAKEGYRAIHGNLHPTVAAVVRNFIDLHLELGEPLEAELMARQADFITREVYGAGSPERAATLAALGRVNWALERYHESARSYRQALELLAQHGRTSILEVTACETGLGRALLAAGEVSRAHAALHRAADTYERAWWLAGGGQERATFMASPYPLLAAAELLARDDAGTEGAAGGTAGGGTGGTTGGTTGDTTDHDPATRAWQALDQHQGRTLRHARRVEVLTPDEQARRDSLQQRAVAISQRLDGLAVGGEHADLAALRRQRARVDAGLRDLDLALRQRLQALGSDLPDPAAVARRLATGTVVIGWLDVAITPGNLDSWAWILTRQDGLHWVRLPAGDPVPDLARRYRATVARAHPAGATLPGPVGAAPAPTGDDLAALGRELFRLRLEPGLPWLRRATTLVAVPGSSLAGIPLATLITDDHRTVHERWAVVVSTRPSGMLIDDPAAGDPAASDAAASDPAGPAPDRRPDRRPGRLLALADPPFRPEHLVAMHRDEQHASRRVLTGVVRGDRGQLDRLARLPATRGEVTAVARLFPHSDLLLGQAAEERSLRQRQRSGALARYDVIHLATHALVDADRPERSALVLSQVARPARGETDHASDGAPGGRGDGRGDGRRDSPLDSPLDGLLTAEEITAGWHLGADLVTLSACETGLGRPAPGEGYLGFTQAFLAAGARSVLVSLWQVDDRATALLMERFYTNLRERGLGKAAALQEAQAWLRQYEVGGRRPFAAPRHWGAFVLVGEG